ncbi:MAG: disulfide bond formation protein B [Gammaproteobacteria bacterium]
MKKILSVRGTDFLAFLICACLIGFAIYLQFSKNIEPCPLCIIQRVIVVITGLLFFLGSLQRFGSIIWLKIYHGFICLVALSGAGIAWRQVWLQLHPEKHAQACAPSLEFMLRNLPLTDTLRLLLTGGDDCATVHWTFLNLSIPMWTLIFFCLLALLALINALRI